MGETGPSFLIWKKKLLIFSLEGLDFGIRFWLWRKMTVNDKNERNSVISRHPLNLLTLVLWTDKTSCLIQNLRGQKWCHVVLKSSSSWSTTRKKKSSSFNSAHPQGVLRKTLFLRAAWAALLAGKLSFWLHVSCAFLSHGNSRVLQDLWLLFPHQATTMPRLFHPCNLKGSKIKVWSLCLGLKQLSGFS